MEQQKSSDRLLGTDSSNRNKNYNTVHLPRIGMRIVKSAIGVFICFLIDMLRGGSGIVFYSQLAVLWCIRDYISETIRFAVQRTIGTILGALWGLVIIVGRQRILTKIGVLPSGVSDFVNSDVIISLITSLSIVLILYITVLLKQKQASYFSCVVFLSIVVNHAMDINPYMFVWNRFLDTMIGIIVGVCLNCVTIHTHSKSDKLFVSGLDDTLLAPGGYISDYSRVELNRMIDRGVSFTVSTIRTPASLMEPLRGIKLKLPVIAMDGAALYDMENNSFEKVYIIDSMHSLKVMDYLDRRSIAYFANVVIEDVLLIYYMETENTDYNDLMAIMKKSPYRNYILRRVPKDEDVVYFTIIDKVDVIDELYEEMRTDAVFDKLKLVVEKCREIEQCALLKIYSHNASKENMLHYLKSKLGVSDIVTFGTIKGKYTYCIEAGDFNRVVKLMKRSTL